jgi:hypothetical protein
MIEEEGQDVEREYETIKIDIPILKKPKIVGAIDLSAINAQIKPKRKSKEARKKEQEELLAAQKALREELKEKRKRKIEEEQETLVQEQVIELEKAIQEQEVKKTGLKVFLTRLFQRE